MFMKKNEIRLNLILTAVISTIILTASGCFSLSPVDTKTENDKHEENALLSETKIQNLPEDQKLKLAEPIIDSVMKGIAEKDYKEYTRYALPSFKENVPQSAFKSRNEDLAKELGDFQSKTFMGVVNKKLFDIFVWKGKFSKSEDEWFMKLYLVDDEGKYKIYMFTISPL